mmetsp:Transcript_77141/g.174487  ORF Transcript_77141/g.174487 Transcript_77141/m.174487 type:complete len:220 (+) Transcript_77141:513-1172(+)
MGSAQLAKSILLQRELARLASSTGRGSPIINIDLNSSLLFASSRRVSLCTSMSYFRNAPASAAMIASFTEQPCFFLMTPILSMAMFGSRVNTRRPLKVMKGFRSESGGLMLSSASGFAVRGSIMPLKKRPMLDSTPRRHPRRPPRGLSPASGLDSFLSRGTMELSSGTVDRTSPPSQLRVGVTVSSRPMPSPMEWWTRKKVADLLPGFVARRMVRFQGG